MAICMCWHPLRYLFFFFFMGTIRHVFAGAEKNVLGEESDDYLLNI